MAGQADSAPNSDASDLVTGIILAGGRSRRLGRDKAQEPFCGQPLIRRADSDRGKALTLGARPPAARIVLDVYPGKGALGGIFSGLAAMRGDWGLVVACDMPFLNPTLLAYMLSLREGFDAVVPRPGAYPEPTHALYSKACLPYIEARLQADDLKVSRFYDQVRVNYLNEAAISPIDPGMRSFFNVNSPEDLAEALALESSPPIAEAS